MNRWHFVCASLCLSVVLGATNLRAQQADSIEILPDAPAWETAPVPEGVAGYQPSCGTCGNGSCGACGNGSCGACGNGSCGGCCGGWIGTVETPFFRYYRADGVRAGDVITPNPTGGHDVEFDYEISPRFEVGYLGASGTGARLRWWDYDHRGAVRDGNALFLVDVDTFSIDAEVLRRFNVCRWLMLEVSGGLRYNEFDEVIITDGPGAGANDSLVVNAFDGFGGIIGAELVWRTGRRGNVFLRAREAVLVDDRSLLIDLQGGGNDQDITFSDSVLSVTELAIGFEYRRCLNRCTYLTLRVSGERQHWENFSNTVDTFPSGEVSYSGPADVGFAGFVLGAGITR